MAQYQYAGLSHDGQEITGVIDGYNELDAATRIKETCEVITKLSLIEKEKKESIFNTVIGSSSLNTKAFTVMCSQFATILDAGVPVSRTVALIAEKTTDKTLKKLLKQVREDVEAGRSLSAAFEHHGQKFLPVTFIETIRAGESSGNLAVSFDTMHEHFDKQAKMRNKVQSAMIYPIFVVVVAVVVVVVLMVKVVPTFTQVFGEFGVDLPFMTRLLIGMADFFQKYIWFMSAVVFILVLGWQLYDHTEEGGKRLSKWSLSIPVLGNIFQLAAASQFANSMAMLLESGLTVAKSVGITAKTLDNVYLAEETGKLTAELESGRTLAASMRAQNVMPSILTDMVAVGEETGKLAGTLDTIAKYYDNELETAITAAIAKMEPTLLIILGVIAGFVVISVYMAIFSMYSTIS